MVSVPKRNVKTAQLMLLKIAKKLLLASTLMFLYQDPSYQTWFFLFACLAYYFVVIHFDLLKLLKQRCLIVMNDLFVLEMIFLYTITGLFNAEQSKINTVHAFMALMLIQVVLFPLIYTLVQLFFICLRKNQKKAFGQRVVSGNQCNDSVLQQRGREIGDSSTSPWLIKPSRIQMLNQPQMKVGGNPSRPQRQSQPSNMKQTLSSRFRSSPQDKS